jgi:hypothetical protein
MKRLTPGSVARVRRRIAPLGTGLVEDEEGQVHPAAAVDGRALPVGRRVQVVAVGVIAWVEECPNHPQGTGSRAERATKRHEPEGAMAPCGTEHPKEPGAQRET